MACFQCDPGFAPKELVFYRYATIQTRRWTKHNVTHRLETESGSLGPKPNALQNDPSLLPDHQVLR